MAASRKNVEYSSVNPRYASFNRSYTINSNPVDSFHKQNHHLDRTGSMKPSNAAESVKPAGNSIGKVKSLCRLFENPNGSSAKRVDESPARHKTAKSVGSDYRVSSVFDNSRSILLPGAKDRIVVYFTSLRGIRRTYEDCYAVRMIFRGFRVFVDERDISMDSTYKKELECVLGEKNVSLPQVFIKGKYVGGAEAIKYLFEVGELAKILEGIPKRDPGFVCQSCGDVRFIPCMTCSGSRKIFDEDEEISKKCIECNENGLIRCPDCGS